MTKMEVLILSYIANTYIDMKDYSKGIVIYSHIKNFVESFYDDKIMAAELLSNFCYNLSICLGQLERYDECIDVAYEGMNHFRFLQKNDELPGCMYNCAWSMEKRNKPRDKEKAIELCEEALQYCTPQIAYAGTLSNKIRQMLTRLTANTI